MYRITATDGLSSDTLVITDLSTGTVVKNPALTDVDVRFRTGHPIIANGTVEVIRPDLEVSSFDWLTRHPITDKLTALAALEFRDGARIEFQDNGAPVVKASASAHKPPPAAPRGETATNGRRPMVIAIYGERGTGKTRTLTAIARTQLGDGRTLAVLKGHSDSYSTSQEMGLENARRVLWFGGFDAGVVAAHDGVSFDTLLLDEAGVFSHDEFQALVAWAGRCGAAQVFAVNPPGKIETVTVKIDVPPAADLLHAVAKSLFGDVPVPPADLTTLEMSEVIAFQLRRRVSNVRAPMEGFWTALRPETRWAGGAGPEQSYRSGSLWQIGDPAGLSPKAGVVSNFASHSVAFFPGEVVTLPSSNLTKVASVLIEPALGGAFIVQGSDPMSGEVRTDLESAIDIAVKWLAAGERVVSDEAARSYVGVGVRSVIIDRYQDADGKDCYAASTSAGDDGCAHSISALTTQPNWTSEESLAGVLDFARQHLAPGESGEVLTATAGA